MDRLRNIHPGEVLLTEFMEPLGITAYRVAKEIGVQQTRIGEIIEGKRAVTPDTAIRLGRFFSVSPQFWLNLQALYDLEREQSSNADKYQKIHAYAEAHNRVGV